MCRWLTNKGEIGFGTVNDRVQAKDRCKREFTSLLVNYLCILHPTKKWPTA